MKKSVILCFIIFALIIFTSCSVARSNSLNGVNGKWIHETTYHDTAPHDTSIVSLEILHDKVIFTTLEDDKSINKEYPIKSLDQSKFTIECDNNTIQYDYKINSGSKVLNLYYEIEDPKDETNTSKKTIVHEVYKPHIN